MAANRAKLEKYHALENHLVSSANRGEVLFGLVRFTWMAVMCARGLTSGKAGLGNWDCFLNRCTPRSLRQLREPNRWGTSGRYWRRIFDDKRTIITLLAREKSWVMMGKVNLIERLQDLSIFLMI